MKNQILFLVSLIIIFSTSFTPVNLGIITGSGYDYKAYMPEIRSFETGVLPIVHYFAVPSQWAIDNRIKNEKSINEFALLNYSIFNFCMPNSDNEGKSFLKVFQNAKLDVVGENSCIPPYLMDGTYPFGINVVSKYTCSELSVSENNKLMNELIKYGPIICGIHVNESFNKYKNGIYRPDEKEILTGGVPVLVTGIYDVTEGGKTYEVVEFLNHFGKDWGENGYCKMLLSDFRPTKDVYVLHNKYDKDEKTR